MLLSGFLVLRNSELYGENLTLSQSAVTFEHDGLYLTDMFTLHPILLIDGGNEHEEKL